MNNAETEARKGTTSGEVRQRKSSRRQSSKSGKKMVGSDSGEFLNEGISQMGLESLDIEEEDDFGPDHDSKRLIPSPVPKVVVQKLIIDDNNYNESELDETVWSISIQMFIPFLLAGFGMVLASLLLDLVQVINFFSKRNFKIFGVIKLLPKNLFFKVYDSDRQ